MNKDVSIYWDIYKTLTYNALFNLVIGNRGSGKTFGATCYVIKRFLKTGAQFVYVRRYKEELKKIGKFFNAIISENVFPGHTFEVKGFEFFIDGKCAGTAMPLSTAKINKSTAYPLVETIIFDEFIIEKGVYHYLPNEVESLLDLYETIARTRDVRLFMLSNAVTMTNPYCLYWNLQIPRGKNNICKKGEILLELVQNENFITMKKETRFGKLISGTNYGDYNIENKFLLDNDTFIAKKGEKASYQFTLIYKSMEFGIYSDISEGRYIVSENVDPYCRLRYAITKEDHSPNTMLIKQLNKAIFVKSFLDNYTMGNVYFESIKIKNVLYEVIKLIFTV